MALEQERLPRLRAAAEDLLDVGPEPDIEHAIGLVQHDDPQLAPDQRAAAHQVQHAARRANDERSALVDLFDLIADRLAAVDGHDRCVAAQGQLFALVADLHGQLAGRHQDQGLRRPAAAMRLQHLQDRNREGGRLAGARLRLAHHVDARQGAGNETGLDRRRLLVRSGGQGIEHNGAQSQSGKFLAVGQFVPRGSGAGTLGRRPFARRSSRAGLSRDGFSRWASSATGGRSATRGSSAPDGSTAAGGFSTTGFLGVACGLTRMAACGLAAAGFFAATSGGGDFAFAVRSAGGFGVAALTACGLTC